MTTTPGSAAEAVAAVRLVASDVDGTLLDADHRVPSSTRAAIARARDRGVTVVLTTSRGPAALLPVLAELDGADGMHFVASHGAAVGRYRGAGGLELRHRRPMALGLAREVTATGTALGLCANWFVADRWLASGLDACVLREIDVVGVRPTVCDLLAEQEPPDKILFMAQPDAVGPLDELHAALPEGVAAQTSNPAYLEITSTGVDKGAALAALVAELGHDAAQVLAIGDGPNDLSMFAYAGVSVAMANARPEVLAAADFVAVSNLENGLGRVLDAIPPGG